MVSAISQSGRPRIISKKRMDSIMSKAMLTLFTPAMLQQRYVSTSTPTFTRIVGRHRR